MSLLRPLLLGVSFDLRNDFGQGTPFRVNLRRRQSFRIAVEYRS
jgi:hypothetical protein